MGRGRKKGINQPLTPAERAKRYREKQKETNPEGYKKKKKKHNKNQYEKKKNNPLTKLHVNMVNKIPGYYIMTMLTIKQNEIMIFALN